jgi:drug/metabolite transporter (DMT)-like permease
LVRYLGRLGLGLIGLVSFVAAGIALENDAGVPFATFYRCACAVVCLGFIWKLRRDYPADRWPQVSLWIALAVNATIFLTPLVDRPASRGELMLFALPDAMIVLGIRIASYHVGDDHQRAMRQMMILGLVVAATFCSILYALILLHPDSH